MILQKDLSTVPIVPGDFQKNVLCLKNLLVKLMNKSAKWQRPVSTLESPPDRLTFEESSSFNRWKISNQFSQNNAAFIDPTFHGYSRMQFEG